jgi:nucleotide-binding universal stress UspA family protein
MFRRILVPLDGSDRAAQAIPVAARLARASGGSIFLARAATAPIVYGTFHENSSMAEMVDSELKDANDYLTVMAHSPTLSGIEVETSVLYGAAAPTLLAMATQCEADLIVMTSQGQTGVKRWLLGSVAQKMARQSPVPVLVLREGGALPVGARGQQPAARAGHTGRVRASQGRARTGGAAHRRAVGPGSRSAAPVARRQATRARAASGRQRGKESTPAGTNHAQSQALPTVRRGTPARWRCGLWGDRRRLSLSHVGGSTSV